MNDLFHPLSPRSRKIAILAALFILAAVPITVSAGLNANPIYTRAEQCYDITGEGMVDTKDVELLNKMVTRGLYKKEADLNGDGSLTIDDTSILRRHQNEVCSPEVTFFADPKTIRPGGATILKWSVEHADSVYIPGLGEVGVEGERNVSPTENSTYLLKASGVGGAVTASTQVEIQP